MLNLSDLQSKDIINIKDGKKIGVIIDVVLDSNGNMEALIIQKNKFLSSFLPVKDEVRVKWNQIKKIGEDVILVDVTSSL
jgi:YlmC/YmxH family sporulation protein